METKLNIIIDTREQKPLDFSRSRTFGTVVKKLDVGDYGLEIDDVLQPICFERKSALDLVATLSQGNRRFKAEVERALNSNVQLYDIVECSYHDILLKNYPNFHRTKVLGCATISVCHTFENKYGIRFIFCNNRIESKDYIANFFKSYVKNRTKLHS